VPVERRTEIQWLRALAAIEVVVVHSDLLTKHFSDYRIMQSLLHKPFGGIGVELFFIVSGYVICMNVPSYGTGWQFIRSRVLRLYPMYWVFTSLVLLAYAVNPAWHLSNFELSFQSLASSYLILPQWGFPILGVGWTLEHEMMFYGFAALFMLVWGLNSLRAKMAVAWSLAGMGLVGCILEPGPGSSVWAYHICSPYMFAFGFGWLLRCGEEMPLRQQLRNIALFAAIGALGYWLGTDYGERLAYRIAVAALIFSGFVACRRQFESDNGLNRFVWKLGDASFSIYLCHWFILSAAGKVMGVLHPPAFADVPVRIAGVALSTAVGVWIFGTLERPIDRWLRKRPAAASPAPLDKIVRMPIAAMAQGDARRQLS